MECQKWEGVPLPMDQVGVGNHPVIGSLHHHESLDPREQPFRNLASKEAASPSSGVTTWLHHDKSG